MRTVAILALAALPALAADWDDWRGWPQHEQETIKKSFDTSAAGRKLLVDTISGYIHVTGYDGNQVQVSVNKQIYGRSPEAVAEAKKQIKLDLTQQGNFVRVYEDGPFRDSNGTHYRGDDYYGYRVIWDVEVQVPRTIELSLHNLNSPMVVKGTSGDYEINGLNGGIEMDDVAGSGKVRTLNGKLKVGFSRNPEHDCEFHTLNGAMDVYFHEPLNADLHFKTLNGGVYADFDVSPLPQAVQGQQRNGKFYYSNNRNGSARAGKGGPVLTFDGLNGAIRLHTKTL